MLHRSRHLRTLGPWHIPAESGALSLSSLFTASCNGGEVCGPGCRQQRQQQLKESSFQCFNTFVGYRHDDEPNNKIFYRFGTEQGQVIFQPPPSRSFASLPHLAPSTTASHPNSPGNSSSFIASDPFSLVREEIESVTERLRRCIMTDIPVLERAAEYFFRAGQEGKRLRSSIILLMATSLDTGPTNPLFLAVDDSPANAHPVQARRRQQRVAEITELIHVASLLHDDVIDNADSRRGMMALNSLFGNKVAILAGDFLLARASVSLAALRNSEVIALMSQVLEHLVEGEILQMTTAPDDALSMDYYLRKSFFKTASLMANSCKSVAVIAGCTPEESIAAWEYGKHLGLAFQLIDDILDFTSTEAELGKPVGNDLRAGLATAPVLFAVSEHPKLIPLIKRRFSRDGDVHLGLDMVRRSSGVEQARELAARHACDAKLALSRLPATIGDTAVAGRAALEEITRRVLVRRK